MKSFAIYTALKSPCAIPTSFPRFQGFIEFLVFRIDAIDPFQLSCIVELRLFLLSNAVFFFATFWVARLTFQTRKLWLVGVATDRAARHACLRFFSFQFFPFFCLRFFSFCFPSFLGSTKKSKKNKERKKRGLQGGTSRDASKNDFLQ